MTSTLRTLVIVFLLPLLLISQAGCAAVSPAPATPPPTADTSTPTHLPTAFPSVTPSPLPSPTTIHPYQGPLTETQRAALLEAALSYVSETPQEATATAIRLGYIKEYGNPATVCGPLSLAILQDAGLVDPSIPLVDFYYLNPRPGLDAFRLENTFPPDKFEKIEQNTSIKEVDYTQNPLYAGDFLYLFAGDSGSFEHMLIVSRVDADGRAYAVTNLNTPEGVVIREVMLYDPNDPGKGQFYDWTNRDYRMLGRTGYGGFWLWRLKSPSP